MRIDLAPVPAVDEQFASGRNFRWHAPEHFRIASRPQRMPAPLPRIRSLAYFQSVIEEL